jgi:phosphoadenosine phosphosulfate reductase
MLIEQTLFGTVDKVALSIARIKEFESQAYDMNETGYFVAFSGGKDSIVILDLVRRAQVKHTANFHLTTVDPPELLEYIRQNHPDVIWHRPRKSMWQLIREKMMPPTRIVRYCCAELKEGGGKNSFVITGVRWAESVKRSKRRMVETCFRDSRKRYLNPIIEWSDDDVWQYIREQNLPYCSLYDEGFKRIGCIGCPMAGAGRLKEFARWPRFEAAYRKTFAAAAAARVKARDAGWKSEHPLIAHWNNGEDMWNWWMNEDRTKPEDSDQGVLFE